MKKIWLTHTLVLCFLLTMVAVGVYAGISTEVGTYVWDSTNSRWTKLLGSSAGAITLGNKTPSDAYTNPTDAINTIGLNMVYDNSNAKWMMARTMGASGTAPTGSTTLASGIVLWDSTASVTRLLKDANAGTNLTTGLPAVGIYGYDSSGGNWDRLNVDPSGNLYVNPGTLTSVSDSVTSFRQKVSSVTTESSTANNCTGTTASLISSNTNRIELMVLNQAPVDAYICFAATCTTTTGMRLQENMSITNEHYTGAVSCITASGNTTVAVKEL